MGEPTESMMYLLPQGVPTESMMYLLPQEVPTDSMMYPLPHHIPVPVTVDLNLQVFNLRHMNNPFSTLDHHPTEEQIA